MFIKAGINGVMFTYFSVPVTVVATAFHKGYYEFRLCENDVPQKGKDSSIAITHDCLNKNLLINAQTGKPRYVRRS